MTNELGFNALYLDTNILTAFNWPTPSVELENLFNVARWMAVSLLLPEPVEREAEEHWLRVVRDSVASLNGATGEFRRVTSRVGGEATAKHDAREVLLKRYRELGTKTKDKFGISSSPFTTRSSADLFELAIRYVLPFEAGTKNNRGEGNGFQDAVILASILDHMKANSTLSGGFVTFDSVLSKVRIDEFMPDHPGLILKVFTFHEAYNLLFAAFKDTHIKKPWAEEEENAIEAVAAMEPDLRAFIKSNLTEEMLEVSGSSKLLDVEKVDVLQVVTPIPDPSVPDRSVRIAISVNAHCQVFFEGMGNFASAFNILAGGGEYRPESYEGQKSWFGGVDATAEVRARKFENINFRSILTSERFSEELPRIMSPEKGNTAASA